MEQVKAVRLLRVCFDVKLTWKVHLDKINNKTKRVFAKDYTIIFAKYTGHS